jgi:hypothetical protein
MKKLFKIALIGFALGASAGVAASTLGAEETTARPCCSSCEETDTWCWRWCSFSC